MKVSVIGGAGYVGLITALGSSSMGHDVISTDIDEKKVKNLNIIIQNLKKGICLICGENHILLLS